MTNSQERPNEVADAGMPFGYPPPAYSEALTLPESNCVYTPPPNYHDIVTGYIDPRPSIHIPSILGNSGLQLQDPYAHAAAHGNMGLDISTLGVGGKTYFGATAVYILVLYSIPMYIVGPFLYTALTEHISRVMCGGGKAFPAGLESDESYLLLSYGLIIVSFLVLKSVLMFFVGKLSYLGVFSPRLRTKVDFTLGLYLLVGLINLVIMHMVYLVYDECASTFAQYSAEIGIAEHFLLFIAYYAIISRYVQKIYAYTGRWNGVYYRDTFFFEDCTLSQIRMYIGISIFLCLLGIAGGVCLTFDGVLEVLSFFGVYAQKAV
ncbi:uncharacterized protein NEMAJ01_1616 [Nematocida major]|uniref:uncharacterized protein n=1 Tax=Nematocida major TaxID=1912982 RepID=UPI002007BB3D|nr:uncharacterized protein NEMAJ01_1616 [Nematocida major]KAH9386720.1 hypothetical protein NEMAJ01_1616 [Nematocida major]